jgi:hypothetical protein
MYIVIEMQTNDGVTAVVPPVAFATRNEAEARYHSILSAAAVSEVEIHACAILNEHGIAVQCHFYEHPKSEPEPEPEVPVEEEPEPPADEEEPEAEGE